MIKPTKLLPLNDSNLAVFKCNSDLDQWLTQNPLCQAYARVIWPKKEVGEVTVLIKTHSSKTECLVATNASLIEQRRATASYRRSSAAKRNPPPELVSPEILAAREQNALEYRARKAKERADKIAKELADIDPFKQEYDNALKANKEIYKKCIDSSDVL